MRAHLLPAIKLTAATLIFFSGIYTLAVWGIAQGIAPNNGKGAVISYLNDKDNLKYGFSNVGQSFTLDKYFWSRPSAVNYNAAGSGGSNKGPSNPDYLKTVQDRIDTFLLHDPAVKKSDIPAELVTASGSGLDPNISPQAAIVQVARIAKARNISEEQLIQLVNQQTKKPLLGLFGTSTVHVLKLNLALDNLK